MILSWSGQYLPTYTIDAPEIADLSLQPSEGPAQHATPASNAVPDTPKAPQQQSFVDPAILSFSKPPTTHSNKGVEPNSRIVPTSGSSSQQVYPPQQAYQGEATVSAALSEPFSNLELYAGNRTAEAYSTPRKNELDGSAPT